jgi:membrane-bound serine protease (ClpP class)
MFILINPDIAYLLLIVGSILLMLAIVTPGTHFMEVGALFCLAGAGYEILQLGFNWWALVVLILTLVPFIYSIRKTGREWALAVSIFGLIVGSLYMFPGAGILPAVNPIIAIIVSALTAGFLWVVVRKSMLAAKARPIQDLDNLIGQLGRTKTEVHTEGSVQVVSELWSARSENPIPAGSPVRVIRREGFTLIVKPEDQLEK